MSSFIDGHDPPRHVGAPKPIISLLLQFGRMIVNEEFDTIKKRGREEKGGVQVGDGKPL